MTAEWGVALAGIAALISGLAIWLNAFAVKQIADASVYTTVKNGVAALVLLLVALPMARDTRLRTARPSTLLGLAIVGVVGGGIAFLLFFNGLAIASAPSAAFIQKTMFVWIALLAVPLLGERLGLVQLIALGALTLGQAVVLPPTGIAWGKGETLILGATLLWSAEVILVRRLTRELPLGVLTVSRLGIGLVVLVGYLAVTGRLAGVLALTAAGWAWVGVTGLILAAYVGTWFAALQRAPATIVSSVLVGGAVATGLLQAIAKGAPPTPEIAGAYVLITSAVIVAAAGFLRPSIRLGTTPEARSVAVNDA